MLLSWLKDGQWVHLTFVIGHTVTTKGCSNPLQYCLEQYALVGLTCVFVASEPQSVDEGIATHQGLERGMCVTAKGVVYLGKSKLHSTLGG